MYMGPDVWGPHGWKFLHFVTIGYPENPTENDKKRYKSFFSLLKHILPCNICSDNYKGHIEKYPLTDDILSDKSKFINWGIKMHNLVNIENNSKVYSDEEALKLILQEKECKKDISYNKEIVIICITISLLLFLILYKQLNK